jgi:hypothetical protein
MKINKEKKTLTLDQAQLDDLILKSLVTVQQMIYTLEKSSNKNEEELSEVKKHC